MEMRVCRKCGKEKPLDQFVPDKKAKLGRMHRCKTCHNAINLERYHRPDVHEREQKRRAEWQRKYYRGRRYGISTAEYDALAVAQDGKCALCGNPDTGRSERYTTWNVDHDHQSGKVRGLLCHKCNIAVGYYEHLIQTIGEDRLMRYLHPERFEEDGGGPMTQFMAEWEAMMRQKFGDTPPNTLTVRVPAKFSVKL